MLELPPTCWLATDTATFQSSAESGGTTKTRLRRAPPDPTGMGCAPSAAAATSASPRASLADDKNVAEVTAATDRLRTAAATSTAAANVRRTDRAASSAADNSAKRGTRVNGDLPLAKASALTSSWLTEELSRQWRSDSATRALACFIPLRPWPGQTHQDACLKTVYLVPSLVTLALNLFRIIKWKDILTDRETDGSYC